MAEGGRKVPDDGGSDIDVAIDWLRVKIWGWSVKMRKREGKGRDKKSAALAHRFDDKSSEWPWYWRCSGMEIGRFDGLTRVGKWGRWTRGSQALQGRSLGAFGAREKRGHG
jgi:hypothetical protein